MSVINIKSGMALLLMMGVHCIAESEIDRVKSYSPTLDNSYPVNVYWGDTHVHTSLSIDANILGNKNVTPDQAYRFAQGETVTANNGMKAKLNRPLDFLVIADHAFNLGLMSILEESAETAWKTDAGKNLYAHFRALQSNIDATTFADFAADWWIDEYVTKNRRKLLWQQIAERADRYNNPGTFTAFTGYEWTSEGEKLNYPNLHRVVIFKDSIDKTGQVLPFSRADSDNPEDLWRYLENYENKTGGEVLAIPHNSNLSNGGMFALTNFEGRPLSRNYAQMRSRWEPLVEVTQIKGDSETHPILSPTDEFADYERWNSWAGRDYKGVKVEGWEKRKASEYVRSALKLGLDQQAKHGVNPFKFGLIGSTDTHTSMTAIEENNFYGKFSDNEPSANRMVERWFKYSERNSGLTWEQAAAGYAAIWAEKNTREALFAAMKRKETYATTGSRMTIRFFGGWDYAPEDAWRPDLAAVGYAKGVPMGGDLTSAQKKQAPTFLIQAVRDPRGANLDRVQVIKGWRDTSGELQEKIYDVALSDNRKVRRDGRVKPVGNTVNVDDASYTNSIGEPELAVVWQDPDFKADEIAFYYVRVLEIPTPRWTAYDAKFFGLEDLPKNIPMVTQERGYTSPIWYAPSAKAGGE